MKTPFRFIPLITAALLTSLLLQTVPGKAQLLNNAATITISAGAIVTVQGDLQLSGAGSFTNSGNIVLTGNWINNSITRGFNTATGFVSMNGVNQSIGGTALTDFNSLSIGPSARVKLLTDVTAGGFLGVTNGIVSLSSGRIILNSHKFTLNNPSPLALTSTSGYFQSETGPVPGYGSVEWKVGETVAGANYNIPFSDTLSATRMSCSFTISAQGTGTTGGIRVSTYPTNTTASPNNRPLPIGVTNLNNSAGADNAANVLDRYWMVDGINYTLRPEVLLSLSYRDREWDLTGGSTNAISENLLKAQRWNGTAWEAPLSGPLNVSTNIIQIPATRDFQGAWAFSGSNNPLPVQLVLFDAALNKENAAICEWVTASEINNDFFTLERSRDGLHFEELGRVDGAGNSTQALQYTFTDPTPFNGVTYYRLRQTDFDGQFSYSEIKTVRLQRAGLQLYPNPASDRVWISIGEVEVEEVRIVLVDATGRVTRQVQVSGLEGATHLPLDLSGLSKGVYQVMVAYGNTTETSRLVVR